MLRMDLAEAEQGAWLRVMAAARQMAASFCGGVDGLGALLGKRRGVFRNEIWHYADSSAKLGLIDSLKAMRRAGDLRLLHAICLEFGHVAIPLPEVALDSASADNVVALAKEFGELVTVYAEAMADGRVTNNEFAAVSQAWGELMAVGHVLMSEVAAKNAALNARQGVVL